MNRQTNMHIGKRGNDRNTATRTRHWSALLTAHTLILSLLWPSGLAISLQAASPEQQKQDQQNKEGNAASSSANAASGAQSPSKPAAEEEYIEMEYTDPFGKHIYRVPKSEAGQSSAAPAPIAVQPAQPAAGSTAATQKPQAATPEAQPQTGPSPNQPGAAVTNAAPASAPPAQAATQPAAAQQAPGADNAAVPIALHLENADLLQVIGIIAAELKINYVVDPQVKGTVNINTLGEVRRGDLFPLLQLILRINGAAVVQTGGFYRIVPLKDLQRLPIDPTFNSDATELPPDDRMVMNIIPLKYVSAPDMTKILTPFLSEGGHLLSHDAGNILLITDSSRSMKRLLELVAMFDSEVFTNQRARLYEIKNSQAEIVAGELKDIFSAYGLSDSAPAIRFIPIGRINSILAVTANVNAYSEVEKWLQKLDQPFHESGVRNFIYKVENGKAVEIADVLRQLLLGLPARPPAGVTPPPSTTMATPVQPVATPLAGGTSPVLQQSASISSSHIRIVADIVNNLLVIQATAQEYEEIKRTLKDLDIVPRQVMLEAKVYEVDLTGDLSGGVTAFLQNRTNAERKPLAKVGSAAFAGDAIINATVGTLVGHTRELLLFLQAAEQRGQARKISAPSLLASDNVAAHINVGTEIPVLTSTSASGVQQGGNTLFAQTVQNLDTGVILTITPRINSSGLVNLQIEQEVSAPVLTTSSSIQSPSISKRSISTQVVVRNGDTIALGGIIQEEHSVNKNRIPLLGDIPYLGAIFGSTTLHTDRTELILLLTPTVIQDIHDGQLATAEFREKLSALRSILKDDEEKEKARRKHDKIENPQPAQPQTQE